MNQPYRESSSPIKWILLGMGGCAIIALLFLGGCMLLGYMMSRGTNTFIERMAVLGTISMDLEQKIQQHPQAVDLLGTPLNESLIENTLGDNVFKKPEGLDLNEATDTYSFEFECPIKGPAGSGILQLKGTIEKGGENLKYEICKVNIGNKTFDLLAPNAPPVVESKEPANHATDDVPQSSEHAD